MKSGRLFVLNALVLLLACAGAPPKLTAAAASSGQRIRLTIVGTNDTHGWIEPKDPPVPGGESMVGGSDILGGYLKILRAQRPDSVILLDGGDLFQGTLVANLTEGASMIRAYNALRYDAVTVGNHEFDYGPEGEPVVALSPSDDPLGNLKKRISEAHFPFLAGNIYDRATGEPVDWPNAHQTKILMRKGIKIGVIGLTTPTTPTVTLGQNVRGLDFRPLAPTAIALAAELRQQGCQIIIVTMHAGAGCPPGNDVHDLSGCEAGELMPFLEAMPAGTVDAVVAGHTHQFLSQFVAGVPVIQSKSYGEFFGMIELTFDLKTGKVDQSATKIWKPTRLCRLVYSSSGNCQQGTGDLIHPTFLGERVDPDPEVAAAIGPDIEAVRERKNERLGPQLASAYTRSRIAESSLGDLVADIMRDNVKDAQVGIMNSGGLRADIGQGPVTYGRVFEALPFENRLAVLQLTGAELMKMLSLGVSGIHGMIEVSGVKMETVETDAAPCGNDGSRLVSATLADGSAIVPDRTYTVVTNDFIAGGGDGFDPIVRNLDSTRLRIREDLPPVREMVVSYFRFHPDLSGPPSGQEARIRMVKPSCGPASSAR